MSTQTNNAYVTKSMNGIISYDDGAGGIMEGGTITANEFIIDEIQSKSPPNIVSLYTNTTTTINIGSSTSTLNVSNINVSNINVPLITFTTLNVSDANSSIFNSSTSNSSTANNGTTNSSTSNSSTANNGTTNSSTANNGTTNSSTANNGTTNSSTANSETTNASTLNASSFNISTTTGTTLNMSTANVSIIYTNEIQSATTANVSLFTLHTGNLNIGNISVNSMLIDSKNSVLSSVNNTTITAGGIIYLNSNGNTEICNSGFGGKMVLSGNQEIRAKDRSMPSYLFTDAFAGGDVNIGNASNNLYLDCPLSSSKSIKCVGLNVSTTANISLLNVSTTNISNLEVNTSTLVNSLTAQNISAGNATISYLECTNISSLNAAIVNRIYPNSTTGNIIIGQAQSGGGGIFLGSSTSATNASTINVSKINVSNIEVNTSTIVNSLTAQNISSGNATISFLQNTYISSLGPTFTNNFYPDLTSGVVNLCNTNIFRGTINIAATANVSNASTNTINIGSATTSSLVLGSTTMAGNIALRTTGNLNLGTQSNQIQMGTSQAATNTISIGTTGASTLNLNCPITPNYNASYNATNGAGVNTNIGYIYNSNTPASFSLATNDAFYNCQQITLVDPGVYMIWIDNKLYNDNVGGSITLYYMRVMVGTTLGGTNVFSGYFNSYAELFNATTPNSQIDSPFTLPYVNTTANQILYTRIRVGRSALGLFWDTSSFIKAVRIA